MTRPLFFGFNNFRAREVWTGDSFSLWSVKVTVPVCGLVLSFGVLLFAFREWSFRGGRRVGPGAVFYFSHGTLAPSSSASGQCQGSRIL